MLLNISVLIFQYSCNSSPLKRLQKNLAWWVGADDVARFYWNGHHHATDHRCACADSKTCIAEELTCNCDGGFPTWAYSDKGVLSDQAALPVKQLNFGGLSVQSQMASFELGPLACSGKKKQVQLFPFKFRQMLILLDGVDRKRETTNN